VNRAIGERTCECVVDKAVLRDEREIVETRACDGDLKVVAAAGPVLDPDLPRIGKGLAEELLEAPVHGSDDSRSHRCSRRA
jgi:hypothetical protein